MQVVVRFCNIHSSSSHIKRIPHLAHTKLLFANLSNIFQTIHEFRVHVSILDTGNIIIMGVNFSSFKKRHQSDQIDKTITNYDDDHNEITMCIKINEALGGFSDHDVEILLKDLENSTDITDKKTLKEKILNAKRR